MNIDSLKSFYLIAKEGNISNVTNAVHLTQSALSQQIQRLESELSKTLLIRSNKGVELTTNGKIVFKYAEHILLIHEKMMMELTASENTSTNIKIQACNVAADYVLPCTLIEGNKAFSNHNYELKNYPSNEIITNVSRDVCDIGFSCASDIGTYDVELVIEKVGKIKIVLVSKNKKTIPDELSLEQLLGSCLINFTETNNITSTLLKNLKRLGYSKDCFNCNLRVDGIESAKKMVLKDFGVAFLPYISIKEELYKKHLKMISIPELNMDLDIIMVYKKDISSHVKDFVLWFKKNGEKSFC